ncbi:TlpA disulfide reductase family protein [uncultured Kriegella sp.]|uniref:TlpA family protein disulfide reductase n=1 Tax=uncultured Kriegella sp. TaxID=1798910 RepID=UPI0030DD18FA
MGNDPDINQKSIEFNSYKISSKVIELDKVVKGIGPNGHTSLGIASRDLIGEEELKGYPKMKSLPDSLIDMKEYLFVLNDFQFFYQNYKQGIYSKEFFLKKAKGNRRKLKDTIRLSDKKIKSTISVVAGYAADSTVVYIVDANNNNDYSDDTPRVLLDNVMKEDDIVANSESVDIEYYDGETIKKDTQLVMITKSGNGKNISLSFRFPQYRYGKVTLGKNDYLIVAESMTFNPSIFFVKDRPYFNILDQKFKINPSQYLEIDGNYVQYTPLSQNLDKIKLTISYTDQESKIIPVSNQVGMFAPEVSGINILNNTKISLKEHRGKYVFLDFWSTACPPCIMEFTKIRAVYDKFSEKEIAIIGIADVAGNIDLKDFLADENVTWPNIHEENPSTIMNGYNINLYPTTYLVDPNGKIIATNLRWDDLNNKLELLEVAKKTVP